MRADRVLHLRELLDKLSSTTGLGNGEKGRCLLNPSWLAMKAFALFERQDTEGTCKSFLKLKTGWRGF